jgi:hypothetical protein
MTLKKYVEEKSLNSRSEGEIGGFNGAGNEPSGSITARNFSNSLDR